MLRSPDAFTYDWCTEVLPRQEGVKTMRESLSHLFKTRLARIAVGAALAFAVAVALVYSSRAELLPEAPDHFTYDWRTVLFSDSQKDSRDDIAIILIDEASLDGYPYQSPVDRGLLAQLIRDLDAVSPKAIGLDFILDSASEPAKDQDLLNAIKSSATPIILGSIDERAAGVSAKNIKFQEDFLRKAGRPAGHLFFLDQHNRMTLTDQAIRSMALTSSSSSPRPAFARLLADIDGIKPNPASPYIAWLSPPSRLGNTAFETFHLESDRNDNGSPKKDPLHNGWLPGLKDKIVLIGGSFTDRDRHLTPFSVVDDARMPGVLVHAQILAQLRDGRSIFVFSKWQEILSVALVFGLGFFAAQRWALDEDEWRVSVAAFIVLVSTSLGLFWAYRLLLPSSTLVLAWPAGLIMGNTYNYLLRKPRRKKHKQTLHPTES